MGGMGGCLVDGGYGGGGMGGMGVVIVFQFFLKVKGD
jgi:hypothetical protein